jgi:membrane protease YdiL (CAAX protease family)
MKARLKKYLKDTRKPVYSAVLVLPFFLIYHLGTIFLRTTYINGADALIMRLLSMLSVHSAFASALVLLACFIIWQLRTRAGWKVQASKVFFMLLESIGFAGLLFAAFGWLSVRLSRPEAHTQHFWEKMVLYCGAGIYEELLFRAFLLGLMLLLFTKCSSMSKTASAVTAVILSALLFSGFHYIGTGSDAFTLASFFQRTLGGLYFSIIFITRGFGVTAATHAIYDILVGILL